MSKEQQELLNEVYRKYADSHEYFVDGWLHVIPMEHSKETFINECKINPKFSKKWGLKIEERELSLEERNYSLSPGQAYRGIFGYSEKDDLEYKELFDKEGRPTKLITVTYNDKTLESYE